MASNFMNLESKPDLYLMIPPPLYLDNFIKMNQTVINGVFPKLIPDIARQLGLGDDKIINMFEIMGGENLESYELFCDGQNCDQCHPNDAGYTYMASQIYKHLINPVPDLMTPPDLDEHLINPIPDLDEILETDA